MGGVDREESESRWSRLFGVLSRPQNYLNCLGIAVAIATAVLLAGSTDEATVALNSAVFGLAGLTSLSAISYSLQRLIDANTSEESDFEDSSSKQDFEINDRKSFYKATCRGIRSLNFWKTVGWAVLYLSGSTFFFAVSEFPAADIQKALLASTPVLMCIVPTCGLFLCYGKPKNLDFSGIHNVLKSFGSYPLGGIGLIVLLMGGLFFYPVISRVIGVSSTAAVIIAGLIPGCGLLCVSFDLARIKRKLKPLENRVKRTGQEWRFMDGYDENSYLDITNFLRQDLGVAEKRLYINVQALFDKCEKDKKNKPEERIGEHSFDEIYLEGLEKSVKKSEECASYINLRIKQGQAIQSEIGNFWKAIEDLCKSYQSGISDMLFPKDSVSSLTKGESESSNEESGSSYGKHLSSEDITQRNKSEEKQQKIKSKKAKGGNISISKPSFSYESNEDETDMRFRYQDKTSVLTEKSVSSRDLDVEKDYTLDKSSSHRFPSISSSSFLPPSERRKEAIQVLTKLKNNPDFLSDDKSDEQDEETNAQEDKKGDINRILSAVEGELFKGLNDKDPVQYIKNITKEINQLSSGLMPKNRSTQSVGMGKRN